MNDEVSSTGSQPEDSVPWYRSDLLDATIRGWFESLQDWVQTWGMSKLMAGWVATGMCLVALLLLCYLGNRITRSIIAHLVHRPWMKDAHQFVHLLLKYKVLTRLSHLVPVFLLVYGLPLLGMLYVDVWAQPIIDMYLIWIGVMILMGLIDVAEDLYEHRGLESQFAIRGITQAMKVIVILVGILLLTSILFSRSPIYFLSGIGAAMAIVLLIFRDTILGLVAGIQLNANRMIQVGDWVQMDSQNADGEVKEVSLTTVRVENWDRTNSLIPAYKMISESFINWRSMEDSGGRRIKRSIMIDMNSIKFLDEEMIQRFRKFVLLDDHLDNLEKEIMAWNKERGVDQSMPINRRCQTNIGVFRSYMKAYLHAHDKIHQEGFTFLVRQLQPTELGLPLEVYVFTNDNRWVEYEDIQGDIFDHLLACVPEFELRVFQTPSGKDFQRLIS